MKTLTFETKEAWAEARRGKITGTRLKDIIVKRGTAKKIGLRNPLILKTAGIRGFSATLATESTP